MPYGTRNRSPTERRPRSQFFDLQDDRPSLPYPVGHRMLHTLHPLSVRLSNCGDNAQSPEVKRSSISEMLHVFELLKYWSRNVIDEIAAFGEDVQNSAPTTAARALAAIKCYSTLLQQMPIMQRALLDCKPEAYNNGWGGQWEEASRTFSTVEKRLGYFNHPHPWETLT